jgi:hypothetical protein
MGPEQMKEVRASLRKDSGSRDGSSMMPVECANPEETSMPDNNLESDM